MGVHSTYTPEIGEQFCEEIAANRSVRDICADENFPDKTTIFRWLAKYPEFRDMYAVAKELAVEAKVEDMFDIGDKPIEGMWRERNAEVQRRKIQCDNIKWYVGHIKPKKYGEKKAIEIEAKVTTETSEAKQLADLLTPEELATLQARMIAE